MIKTLSIMNFLQVKHPKLIKLAKKYRRWVFSRRAMVLIMTMLMLEFSVLVMQSLLSASHALSNSFIKLFVSSFMLSLGAISLGWVCDALLELVQKKPSLAACVLLSLMGCGGLAFSAWQIRLRLVQPSPFATQSGHTK